MYNFTTIWILYISNIYASNIIKYLYSFLNMFFFFFIYDFKINILDIIKFKYISDIWLINNNNKYLNDLFNFLIIKYAM